MLLIARYTMQPFMSIIIQCGQVLQTVQLGASKILCEFLISIPRSLDGNKIKTNLTHSWQPQLVVSRPSRTKNLYTQTSYLMHMCIILRELTPPLMQLLVFFQPSGAYCKKLYWKLYNIQLIHYDKITKASFFIFSLRLYAIQK